ncbi:hypothetical protein ACKKBF_B34120 [Auxenochlorella protothecoides x Auxenochlorella symbiontica]
MASQVEALKYIPGTSLNVDGFRFLRPGARHFFLTHFHGDHTTGLTKGFDAGTIYCSPVTARLLIRDMGLRAGVVCPLSPHVTVEVGGVAVTPLPANHCPGAVMFLFVIPGDGGGRPPRTVLHTGDMRWDDGAMMAYPALRALGTLDTLVLDTTYCAPRWTFPPQEQVIQAAAEFVRREAARSAGRVLAVANSYHIGKERFYFGLALRLGSRVFCTPQKARVLSWLDLPPAWLGLLTQRSLEADVHLLGPGEALAPAALEARLCAPAAPWACVVGFRATGWSYKKAPRAEALSVWREGRAAVVGAPYSEHSSWADLRACVASLRPRRIIPSVNAADSGKARALVDCFADLMDLRRDRSRLHAYFRAAKESVLSRVCGGERHSAGHTREGGLLLKAEEAECKEVEEEGCEEAEEAECKETEEEEGGAAACQAADIRVQVAHQSFHDAGAHAQGCATVRAEELAPASLHLIKVEHIALSTSTITKGEEAEPSTPHVVKREQPKSPTFHLVKVETPAPSSPMAAEPGGSQSATDWEDGSPGGHTPCSKMSTKPPACVDLANIDVGEQARILADILAQRAGTGKRKAAAAASLVQGSLKRLWGGGKGVNLEVSPAATPCMRVGADLQAT